MDNQQILFAADDRMNSVDHAHDSAEIPRGRLLQRLGIFEGIGLRGTLIPPGKYCKPIPSSNEPHRFFADLREIVMRKLDSKRYQRQDHIFVGRPCRVDKEAWRFEEVVDALIGSRKLFPMFCEVLVCQIWQNVRTANLFSLTNMKTYRPNENFTI